MNRMMLPLFIACVFSMASVSNAQCDDAAPVCPERVAVAYEILLAEMSNDFMERMKVDYAVVIRRTSEGSRSSGFGLLSNLETYFFIQAITGDENSSVLTRPQILAPFDTKNGFVTGTEKEWYKIALVPKRVENSSDVISTRVTLVRTVLQDGEEMAYPYETTTVPPLPAGATILLIGTLGDKDVILLITPRIVVLDE